ncbi:hypothetical protein HHX47_DHR5000203 [Lentinula edodes]|nr:hypothetical protein HHX47_DHR5000203 [Lentinula edodes]
MSGDSIGCCAPDRSSGRSWMMQICGCILGIIPCLGVCMLLLKFYLSFDKDGLSRLIKVLHIPDPFVTTRRGYRFQAFDALCILCARLAYPARLSDLQAKFGIREARISACINDLSSYIYKFWSHLLDLPPNLVNPSNLERYASVIHAGGAPTKEVAAFLDGTINLICRPGTNQKIVYNGYYAGHALKFQGLCGPDGMMLMVYGPIEGRRADGGLLAASELISKWKNKGRGFGNRQLVIYADPAYAEGDVIMSGRKEVYTLPALEQQLNTEMSRYRQAIEWTFGKIYQNWHAFTLHDQQRLFLSPIGLLFSVACLLTNAHTCLYGSQTSQYFDLAPPTLEEYFVHI